MTLVEFLKARFNEDYLDANAWRATDEDPGEMDVRWYKVPTYTPARIVAEVEAKRRIIEEVEAADWLPSDQRDDEPEYAYGIARGFMDALKILALPYADHPDYREEWRP